MALYGANCALGAPFLETPTTPTDNLLDAHLSSLTTISALTFSVAILSFFMPRLKSRVVNCREFVNCRELLQSSAQRRSQCWRGDRNCLPERQYTTHAPGVGNAHGLRWWVAIGAELRGRTLRRCIGCVSSW